MRIPVVFVYYTLLLAILSHTNASPTEISNYLDDFASVNSQTSNLSPAVQHHQDDNQLQSVPTSAHRKRSTWLADIGRGWVGHMETFESFLPAQIATTALLHFYNSAYNHVQGIRNGRTPDNYYACELDNIILEFYSADMVVPWDFVLSFITKMAIKVDRGFAAQFTYLYVHMPTGKGMKISLVGVSGACVATLRFCTTTRSRSRGLTLDVCPLEILITPRSNADSGIYQEVTTVAAALMREE